MAKRSRAEQLAEALARADIDAGAAELARQLLARIRLPMAVVLAKVPGGYAAAKARKIGVTRATYYSWYGGLTRPKRDQAKKLEELTGFAANLIHGDPDWDGDLK